MHVVHLETGRHLYGGARQVLYLLGGLAQAGVDATLVCPPGSAIANAAADAGFNVHCMRMSGDLDVGFSRRFSAWLNANNADLLHVHSRRGADIWGGMAARLSGTPAVLSRRVDNPDLPVLGRIKYGLYRRVIAISEAIRTQVLATGISPAKVRLVHSAISLRDGRLAWTASQFHDAFQLQAGELTVVCVAQFIARKGHAVLLDAWPEIVSACPQARLLLFGHGDEEAQLRALVEHSGCAGSIRFCGFREDLIEFLAHADVLVHPALREGLGICLLEAQAVGVPVVASRAGGIPEAVPDGVAGLLVEPQNAAQLAAAVIGLLQQPERRAELGAGGRNNVAENYSVGRMVSGNLSVYEEILK